MESNETIEPKPTEECLNAPVYIVRNLLSLPKAGKWLGSTFDGMVIRRSQLEHPGVEISRLCRLRAIEPGSLQQLDAYEVEYGEPAENIARRTAELAKLRNDLKKRMACVRKDSERVLLLLDLIREWSEAESAARKEWQGKFGEWIGLNEEQIKRLRLAREYRLRTLAGREAVYRDALSEIGETLLIAAAGIPGFSAEVLQNFLKSTSMQFNGINPVQWPVEQWLPHLRHKLLYKERGNISQEAIELKNSTELAHHKPRVFLVHGHDQDALNSTYQHLNTLNIEYVVLEAVSKLPQGNQ
jgi:hypothetical protein